MKMLQRHPVVGGGDGLPKPMAAKITTRDVLGTKKL